MDYRIGIGYDIHKLVKGRKLYLGGIEIPYAKGLLGHSDADVLLHAICDAILGALTCNDIGKHFPNTDKRYKDIRSTTLLKKVSAILKKKGYGINNLDTMIIAERPKIDTFRDAMRSAISKTLKIRKSSVNIKATTSEGIGEIGKNLAIAAYAAVTLKRR